MTLTAQATNFVNVAGPRGAMVSSARQTATNVEGFFETHLTLRQNPTAVVGAALARNQRRNERRVGGAPDYNLTFDDVMPKPRRPAASPCPGELTWENRHRWYAGPTFEWVPEKTWIDHRNTFAARPHALAGFRLGGRATRGLSWFYEVRNVFDENTIASTGVIEDARGTDQPQFLPGGGRGYFGGGEYRW